eukprot:TRINITY_DN5756_c0_g1_i2.p1 TRINITY_DN5756_c0_g1~~TRINITY_DN5756_c0_g1_i2.p1  ORF type:complete len:365 (-),score=76.84 TRINITY_DN5756_c0_g1_i2:85-1179(-)
MSSDKGKRKESSPETTPAIDKFFKRTKPAEETASASSASSSEIVARTLHQVLEIADRTTAHTHAFEAYFLRIADDLMNKCIFYINKQPHRFIEIEFYYNGYNHVDPFAHCDPEQKLNAHWYFHKTGKNYRGGTFKGLDIGFGDGNAFGGILIRGIEKTEAPFNNVDGPSLTVDYILKTCKVGTIVEFVEKYGISAVEAKAGESSSESEKDKKGKSSSDGNKMLFVKYVGDGKIPHLPVLQSARVGLGIKKYKETMEHYFAKHYRFFTQPSKTKKGKHYMAISLHQKGNTKVHICGVTKMKAVDKHIELFEKGRKIGQDKEKRDAILKKQYMGVELESDDICELLGLCSTYLFPSELLSSSGSDK